MPYIISKLIIWVGMFCLAVAIGASVGFMAYEKGYITGQTQGWQQGWLDRRDFDIISRRHDSLVVVPLNTTPTIQVAKK